MVNKKVLKKYIFLVSIVSCLVLALATRLIGITRFPPSLYWEEVALGYDAFSILKTARDHHGNFLPITAFESFGDFKPSFYFYSLIPSIGLFGLTDFAVRFPNVISGVLLVFFTGLIAREVGLSFEKKESSTNILQFIASFVTAINPWAIQFSRGAWEVNVATMLLTAGTYLQLFVRRKLLTNLKLSLREIGLLLLGTIFFALSTYTYHATRVVAPLLLLSLWTATTIELWFGKKRKRTDLLNFLTQQIKWFTIAGITFIIFILPLLNSLTKPETKQRFSETSLFGDGKHVLLSNQFISNIQPNFLGKVLYHRYLIAGQMLVENYLKHFSLSFLFLNGDSNPRHSTQFVGLMYSGEFMLILAGIFFMISRRNNLIYLLVIWLFIGIIPASLTTATPHALRILPTMPVFMICLALGIYQVSLWIFQLFNKVNSLFSFEIRKDFLYLLICFSFAVFYGWQFTGYWRYYSIIYPNQQASEWQYGYKQMIGSLSTFQKNYPQLPVQITREYGRPAMYYWFYTQTDPQKVQANEANSRKDQGETLSFENIAFVDRVDANQKALIASSLQSYEELPANVKKTQILDKILDPRGNTVWVIYLTE